MLVQLLKRLFSSRNPLASPQAEVRLSAIRTLSAEQAAAMQERLAECARGDPDEAVRLAAIAQLQDKAALTACLQDPALVSAAAARLAGQDAPVDHPAVRQARMRAAASAECALQVAAETTSASELAELYLCCPEPWREALLKAVRGLGEVGLSALEKLSRNRDKASNRIARRALEQLRAQRKTMQALRERAQELAEVLGKPSGRNLSPRIVHLKNELKACCEGMQAKADALAEYGLTAPDLSHWLALAQYEAEPTAPPPAASQNFEDLVDAFAELAQSMASGAPFADIKAQREALTEQWLIRADQAQPEHAQHAVFEQASHQYQALADAHERLVRLAAPPPAPPPVTEWPQTPEALQAIWSQQRKANRERQALERQVRQLRWPDWAQPSAPVQQLIDQIDALREFDAAARQHQEQLAEQLRKAVAEADAQVAEGHLKGALSALGKARKLEKSLPDAQSAPQRSALARASAKVDELRDWQTFATTPKREQLLQAMKALADAPLHPKDQAASIKSLRNDWNALGNPASSAERALHSRFNQAAERAFDPCRAYFAEQNEVRRHNLAERQRICEQLETYLASVDWSTADMKAAEQIMRLAREEWRRCHPVDRHKGKGVSRQFERAQKQIHAQVKKAWDANLALKQELVAAAAALVGADDEVATKVSAAKQLQQRWRQVGITPRSADQKLWRQFRENCDLVFAARDADRRKAGQRIDETVTAGENICRRLEQAVDDSAPPDPALVGRLRGELHQLDLPGRRGRALEKRFDELARAYNQRLLAHELHLLNAELAQLKRWDAQVSEAEAEGRAPSLPSPAFTKRSAPGDVPAALLRLTLLAELDAGIESPTAEAAQRLQVQAEALQDRMGARRTRKSPKALAEEWCGIGPKPPNCNPLRDRFFTALQAMTQPDGGSV